MNKDITQIRIVHIPCKVYMKLESTLNDNDAIFVCPECGEQIITKVVI